jgi:hypothetical protein
MKAGESKTPASPGRRAGGINSQSLGNEQSPHQYAAGYGRPGQRAGCLPDRFDIYFFRSNLPPRNL